MPAPISRFAPLVVLLLAVGAATGCGDTRSSALVVNATGSAASGAGASTGESPFRFFSPTSFWNTPLPAHARVDRRSAAVVGAFDEEVVREEQGHQAPFINTVAYSVPIYTVAAAEPTVRVTLDHTQPPPSLQAAWDAVPLPPDAKPAAGTDGHLVVWQPSTDRLWEFWRLEQTPTGWQAAWGGAIRERFHQPRRVRAKGLAGRESLLGRFGVLVVDRRGADHVGRSRTGPN